MCGGQACGGMDAGLMGINEDLLGDECRPGWRRALVKACEGGRGWGGFADDLCVCAVGGWEDGCRSC